MSTTFHDIFAIDQQNLEQALVANVLEKNHLCRCMALAQMLQWPTHRSAANNRNNEFGQLLGIKGVALFDVILARIVEAASRTENSQLREPDFFMYCALYVHDLGKFDQQLGGFNGSNHEERSAQIVMLQRMRLINQLGWHTESVDILVALARFHAYLGIIHLGGASMVYLAPLLDWITQQTQTSVRLFLDLLIILNCCDAGASGNFETRTFYLNASRLTNYINAADQLLHAADDLACGKAADSTAALTMRSVEIASMVKRIQRIVSSNNYLSAEAAVVESALGEVIDLGLLNPTGFALTRFDHGTYVFEPLLRSMSPETSSVSRTTLTNVLLLIGVLSQEVNSVKELSFRDTFSMKPDLRPQNQHRFDALLSAVSSGSPQLIQEFVASYVKSAVL